MSALDYRAMKEHLGMVVPVWFPTDTTEMVIRNNLRAALEGWDRYLRPEAVVLSVDGCPAAAAVIEKMRTEGEKSLPDGIEIVVSEQNRGKGHAVALGFRQLLQDDRIEFLAARDVDGDHLINDLENLYRIALQTESEKPPGVLVIGRRHNLHAPLGFERAEFEIWIDRCLLETFQFGLGRGGRMFDRRFCSAYADSPDFQSGYKLYSRTVAERFLPTVIDPHEADRKIVWQASEVVPVVEAVLMGATVAEITRMTAGEQPVSGFGDIDRPLFYGEKLYWTFRRMNIDPEPAGKIMHNHLARSKLFWSTAGRDELVRACAVALGGDRADLPPIPEII